MRNTQELERQVSRNQAIVVDNAMELTNIVEWSRAATLVISDEAYTLIPRSDGSLLRSSSLTIPMPLVVCLNRYVPKRIKSFKDDEFVSKRTVLIRDDYTCQYCNRYGDTIDHIFPKSRGGQNTWGNLCAACKECNGTKANQTPEEAGMRRPNSTNIYLPRRKKEMQETIYGALTELMV